MILKKLFQTFQSKTLKCLIYFFKTYSAYFYQRHLNNKKKILVRSRLAIKISFFKIVLLQIKYNYLLIFSKSILTHFLSYMSQYYDLN